MVYLFKDNLLRIRLQKNKADYNLNNIVTDTEEAGFGFRIRITGNRQPVIFIPYATAKDCAGCNI